MKRLKKKLGFSLRFKISDETPLKVHSDRRMQNLTKDSIEISLWNWPMFMITLALLSDKATSVLLLRIPTAWLISAPGRHPAQPCSGSLCSTTSCSSITNATLLSLSP